MSVNKEKFLDVSKSIAGCIISGFDSSIPKLEQMLKMITKNLTYDDPGMFIQTLVCDEEHIKIQDATVNWLINQVIWFSNEPQYYW